MEQKQFLTKQQIDFIMHIVVRDYVGKQAEDAYTNLLESDEFKAKYEELKKEGNQEYINAENTYKNNLKVSSLFKQIKEINPEFILYTNDFYKDEDVSWLVSATDEQIKEIYEGNVKQIDSAFRNRTITELKINNTWDIICEIKYDLIARLELITPGTFDEIISDIVKYIDINKYLYIK